MRTTLINDSQKLGIYQKSPFADVDENLKKKGMIANDMVLITGTTGSGKTVCSNGVAWELYNHKYTVVYVTEKPGKSLDNGFFIYPVEEDYHKKLLSKMSIEPLKKSEQEDLLKIYHPFTFNLPKNQEMPPMNLFTFPMRQLSEKGLNAILGGTSDKETVRISQGILSQLDKKDNLWDFLWMMSKQIGEESRDFSYRSEGMGIPYKMKGDSRGIGFIRDSFKIFSQHFALQPDDHPLNLDFVELLNDQKHIHMFTLKWIPEERMKFFFYIELIDKIEKALDSGKIKHGVCLVLEEIKILLPKAIKTTYQEELAAQLVAALSTTRVKGKGTYVVATTQNYYGTYEGFRSSVNERLLFRLSPEDVQRLIKYANFKQVDIDRLNGLQTGEFYLWSDITGSVGTKFVVFPPPYSMAEEGRPDFLQKFKQYYPEKLVTFSETIKMMEAEKAVIEKKAAERLKEEERRFKEREQNKQDEKYKKREKKSSEPTKTAIHDADASIKRSMKADRRKAAYDARKQNMLGDWKDVAQELGLTVRVTQSYAEAYARKLGDKSFYTVQGWMVPAELQEKKEKPSADEVSDDEEADEA